MFEAWSWPKHKRDTLRPTGSKAESTAETTVLPTDNVSAALDQHGLKLFIGTWNMNGREPPVSLAPFLPKPEGSGDEHGQQTADVATPAYHLVVVGTQECLSTAGSAVFFAPEHATWEQRISTWLGDDYALIGCEGMGALHLAIFAWRPCWRWIRAVESAQVATGMAGILGNKGAVGISVLLGDTSLLFVNAHLAAHQDRVKLRNHDYARIERELQLHAYELAGDNASGRTADTRASMRASDRFDVTFWLGDLNYRAEATRQQADVWINAGELESLLEKDQLLRERNAGRVFQGYDEAPIEFPPTYKFDVMPPRHTTHRNGKRWRRALSMDFSDVDVYGTRTFATALALAAGDGIGEDAASFMTFATVRAEAVALGRPAPQHALHAIPPPAPPVYASSTTSVRSLATSQSVSDWPLLAWDRSGDETGDERLAVVSTAWMSRYDTSHKRRVPSWTDRILFRLRRLPNTPAPLGDDENTMHCLRYSAVMEMMGSDHRPVVGVYRVPFCWTTACTASDDDDDQASVSTGKKSKSSMVRGIDKQEKLAVTWLQMASKEDAAVTSALTVLPGPIGMPAAPLAATAAVPILNVVSAAGDSGAGIATLQARTERLRARLRRAVALPAMYDIVPADSAKQLALPEACK
ncbi:Endonuclease/exonuclease/phosphatase [Thamnocephalis sphaerospora]|uniref:Endonuclease/exonuclease/phosphatase n=1 Tax=Thamnocephalis sphaerospora TaxID=78915 RepID=A0A4P9XTL1_9FUNG|nr:Endonuclease/exonuclease/phosphatase [Thamnocephalis sphaerospora]|eukprot:RKP09518.1 Endonuclease/exonuclease/phosphatase [Thamnocephalis sphaerospora]